jgi:hypothetical protein
MDICTKEKPFPYLLIRNFYEPSDLDLIWEELKFLTHSQKLHPPELTGQPNKGMKSNKGLFLDNCYTDRDFSNILKVNRKVFSLEVLKAYGNLNYLNRHVFLINHDTTLVSYYENSNYYKSHTDNAVITAVSYFFKEPRQFEGGNLIFTEFDETVEIENNMLVIFPSFAKHEVQAITMDPSSPAFSGNGRYCISQFMSIN